MNTVFLAPELFASEGGIPRILRVYLKALSELAEPDNHISVLVLNDSVMEDSEIRAYTNKTLSFWMSCSRDKKRFVKEAFKVGRRADVIVCGHVGQLPVALLCKLIRPSLRYYVIAHGIEVWGPLNWIKRTALRRATNVICVSEYTRAHLLKQCPLKKGKAVVLYNALDPFFKVAPGEPLERRPPIILTITRLSHADRYKGIEHLIEAMPAILKKEPETTLRIIGRGDDLARLQRLATSLGLYGKSVIFLGFVTDEDMNGELARCNLFALPSRDEGFGLVYLEAMTRGRPCLGALSGGAPEVIREGCGVLARYGDAADIAEKCVQALQATWDTEHILKNAQWFSYAGLKSHLSALLRSSQNKKDRNE